MPQSAQVRLTFRHLAGGGVTDYSCDIPLTIGRSPDSNNIVLSDGAISRHHARLELRDDHLILFDLDSANGTYVNGLRNRQTALKNGDIIRIGSYEISWAYIGPATGATEQVPAAELMEAVQTRRSAALQAAATGSLSGGREPANVLIPARQVVEGAEAHNLRRGHELDGFLSTEYGFLPTAQPLSGLPGSHQVWDDMVDQLPALLRTLTLRPAFDRLPILETTPDALPDRYLLRASTMLGTFCHAYYYGQTDSPDKLPDCLLKPWREISQRLGKDIPSVSYIDLFLYNWKLRDPSGARRLDNMDLLVPAWSNEAERIFYLVTTEFAMQLTPVLNAMLQAQEAAVREDRSALEAALLIILDQLRYVTQVIYPQIDPNSSSKTHLDQVLWAKTVGTAGVPIFEGAPSPAGTAQPQIHALDAFFERKSYDSLVGQQSAQLAGQFPRHWRELVAALRQVSVRQFVERSQDNGLRGLYNATLDAYIGDKGWMGLHRIKAYGFLEVAFKVGRAVTTGAKFTGLFKDKTWEKIDGELADVRDERYPAGNQQVYSARLRSGMVVTDPKSRAWMSFIELDVAGQGVHYQPGDRIGVLAENDEALVRKTLRALQAEGDEIVRLSPQWLEAIRLRAGYSDDIKVLPLRAVLSFGKIRPVTRGVAKRLLAISASGALKRIVDARMEDQWEIWDVLNLLYAGGFDVTRLWKAGPRDPESICGVVPPDVFRLYSISSAMDEAATSADTLRLVVGGLEYQTPDTPYSYAQQRAGTASSFWRHLTSDPKFRRKQLSLTIVSTPRFRLPVDSSRPVIMFAAGSGIAPFYGFVEARSRQPGGGENWLFFGTRTAGEFSNRRVLESAAADGRLELRTAFSQADVTARFDQSTGQYVFAEGQRQRIGTLIESDEQAAMLWDFLRSERVGGRHGYFYVCGKTSFASSVMESLKNVIRRHGGGSAAEVNETIRDMIAEGRFMQDIFTTYGGHAQEGDSYDISTLVMKNTPGENYWMAVSGKIYDMTEFIHQHVGGAQIIRHYIGTDATGAYRGVLHHVNSEIDAMLGMYELGNMRRLDFKDVWRVILTADGLRFMRLEEMFPAWVRYIYLVVGMENALEGDYGFARMSSTSGEDPAELTPFKAQYVLESHRRFLVSYLDGLASDDLQTLWRLTCGFCAPDQDSRWLETELDAIKRQPSYRLVRNSVEFLKRQLFGLKDIPDVPARSARYAQISKLCSMFPAEDKRVLYEMKSALRNGIRHFERHEAEVLSLASAELMASVRQTLAAVADYYRRLAELTAAQGISLAMLPDEVADEAIPADTGLPGHGGKL